MIKPNFSTLGSFIEIQPQGSIISFVYHDSIRNLFEFNGTILYEEDNLSQNPVDILSFENFFLECGIAQGMILEGRRSRVILNFILDINPRYKYIEKFRGGVQWYMMEVKDIISSISFELKNENNQLVSFIGQSITFR